MAAIHVDDVPRPRISAPPRSAHVPTCDGIDASGIDRGGVHVPCGKASSTTDAASRPHHAADEAEAAAQDTLAHPLHGTARRRRRLVQPDRARETVPRCWPSRRPSPSSPARRRAACSDHNSSAARPAALQAQLGFFRGLIHQILSPMVIFVTVQRASIGRRFELVVAIARALLRQHGTQTALRHQGRGLPGSTAACGSIGSTLMYCRLPAHRKKPAPSRHTIPTTSCCRAARRHPTGRG